MHLAAAQDLSSAKAFLVSVYQNYGKGGQGIDQSGPKASKYFHSSLIALLKADVKAVGSDVPVSMDGDLLCDCQDWDGIYDLKIDIQPGGAGRATATVSFSLFDGKDRKSEDLRKLKITLAVEHGEWRIYDILSKSEPGTPFDLREEIRKELKMYSKEPPAKSAK
jgi:hypothetical protein